MDELCTQRKAFCLRLHQIKLSPSNTEKFFLNLVNPNQNLDCNYTFPIDLALDGIPFDAKSIGKV